jgi:HSP20 family molecular chaperone IbpA
MTPAYRRFRSNSGATSRDCFGLKCLREKYGIDKGEREHAMNDRFPRSWMWSEAVDMLTRAERLHRQFFEPRRGPAGPTWEPPVDIIETEDKVLIFAALPGVKPENVDVAIDGDYLAISGSRHLPPELATAAIHRLELPQGRFSRHVPLPPGYYSGIERASIDGCIVITLHKAERGRG